eukprot:m.445339 g.445339  ORF g.445339 m.445339 type:complete len:54 (-) comp19214_c0_seq1:2005-2166(-)
MLLFGREHPDCALNCEQVERARFPTEPRIPFVDCLLSPLPSFGVSMGGDRREL